MATQTFEDFFSGVRMTQLAQAAVVKTGIPRVLPPEWYTPGPTKPFSDQVQFDAVTWDRGGARVVARNSPPFAVNIGQTQRMYATIFNMKEEYDLDLAFLNALFSDMPMVRDGSLAELNRRMIAFNMRTETTRTNMVHSLAANGKIWIGSAGQVLASASGAVLTMDPGVPTANKITKDGAGSTYNIGDWSSAATDIPGKLRAAQEAVLRTSGRLVTTILYGTAIPGYLAANTAMNPFFIRNSNFRDTLVATNDIPSGLLGFRWIPARLAFLVDTAGTPTATFPTNFIAIAPDMDNDWYEFVEGGTLTPAGMAGATEVVPGASLESMLGTLRTAYGKYAYGVSKTYPVAGLSYVQGDCSGPVLKVPSAYMFGTCS